MIVEVELRWQGKQFGMHTSNNSLPANHKERATSIINGVVFTRLSWSRIISSTTDMVVKSQAVEKYQTERFIEFIEAGQYKRCPHQESKSLTLFESRLHS